MKMRKDKQDAILPRTESTYISELEKASLEVQGLTEQTKEKTEQFYLEMPKLKDFVEMEQQVDSLRRAAVTMSKTMAQTYAISDELSARR